MLFRVPPRLSLLAAQIGLIIKDLVVLFKIRVLFQKSLSNMSRKFFQALKFATEGKFARKEKMPS